MVKQDAAEPRYRHSVPFRLSAHKRLLKFCAVTRSSWLSLGRSAMCIETGSVNSYSFIIMEVT